MKGTAQLPALLADLRDPRRRSERLSQGALTAVEAALASAPAAPAPKPVPPPPAPVAPPVPAPVAAPPEPVPVAPPAPPPIVAPPVVEPVVEPPPPPKSPPPAPPIRIADGTLAAKLAEARSLTARFHVLRRHLADANGLPADGLRSIVEAFPDGWARRRALVELLRHGAPAGLGDALGLVAALGSERDRLWCLGTLAEDRALGSQDRETLLAAAPTPTARRRLERRLG
jgi:hypothetical protein